jgi:exonuclease III
MNKKKKLFIVAGWNARTLLDAGHQLERKTAIVVKTLKRYNVDIAALSETRLPDIGKLEEINSGYVFFWKGLPSLEHRQSGVGFAIRSSLVKWLDTLPTGISDRIMSLRFPISRHRYMTIVSAYAPS